MRGATQCARRLKQLVRSLRTKLGKIARPPAGDAVTQMILGIFSRDVPEAKARDALDQLRAQVVDYNELRVIPAIEMTEMVGELPDARLKCEDLSRALNKVFTHEHAVSLDRLSRLSKKEVVEYLDSIDGLDAYSRARVRLLGLRQHAIPLDEAMWAYARKCAVVDQRCPLEEAQAFLERRIPEDGALEFVGLLGKQAWAEMGAAVRSGEVEHISSVPPDRTARNMLQMVASGRSAGAAAAPPDADDTDQSAATPAAGKNKDGAGKPRKKTAKPRADKAKTRKSAPRGAVKAATKPKRKKATAKTKAKTKAKIRSGAKRRSKPVSRGHSKTKRTVRAKAARQSHRSHPKAKSA